MKRYIYIVISLLILLLSCKTEDPTFDITPNPSPGSVYLYEISGTSARSLGDNEETMNQSYSFEITFGQQVSQLTPLKVIFKSYTIDTPEDDLYEDVYYEAQQQLLVDTTYYSLKKDGTFSYQSVIDDEQFAEEIDFNNPEIYIQRMKEFILESLRVNLFTEWIAYVPKEPITKNSTWKTSSDLSLMSITEVDRQFTWKVEKITSKTIHLKGTSKVETFDFDMMLGPEGAIRFTFDGNIISNYTYELSKEDMLIQKAHIQLITDGRLISREAGPDKENINELLKGEANTYISRK
jgi:uncharacterized protein YqkB